ncbi:hypothetical protein BDZ89DRAFT_1051195 [Hymenopellis radicata]|nr:hypothetical protein BDZ89DRAFT_1051195 [Hymenopellis radicata]
MDDDDGQGRRTIAGGKTRRGSGSWTVFLVLSFEKEGFLSVDEDAAAGVLRCRGSASNVHFFRGVPTSTITHRVLARLHPSHGRFLRLLKGLASVTGGLVREERSEEVEKNNSSELDRGPARRARRLDKGRGAHHESRSYDKSVVKRVKKASLGNVLAGKT